MAGSVPDAQRLHAFDDRVAGLLLNLQKSLALRGPEVGERLAISSPAFMPGTRSTWRTAFPSCRRSKPSLISIERQLAAHEPVDRQTSGAIQRDVAGDIARRDAGADIAALQRPFLRHQLHQRHRQRGSRRRQAGGDRGAARRVILKASSIARTAPAISNAKSTPPPVSSRTCSAASASRHSPCGWRQAAGPGQACRQTGRSRRPGARRTQWRPARRTGRRRRGR